MVSLPLSPPPCLPPSHWQTFDSVLDEYLMAQKAKFVYVRAWRLPLSSHVARTRAPAIKPAPLRRAVPRAMRRAMRRAMWRAVPRAKRRAMRRAMRRAVRRATQDYA